MATLRTAADVTLPENGQRLTDDGPLMYALRGGDDEAMQWLTADQWIQKELQRQPYKTGWLADGTYANPVVGGGAPEILSAEQARAMMTANDAVARGYGRGSQDDIFDKAADRIPGALELAVKAGLGSAFGNAAGGLSGLTSGLGNGFAGINYLTPGGAEISGGSGATNLSGGGGVDTLSDGNAANGLRIGSTASGMGAELGTGLTSGTNVAALGDGAFGTGVSAGGAASGALAPGYFAGESLYPVAGGLASSAAGGALSGLSGSAASAGGGALARLLNGSANAGDYASILGSLGAAGLGAYASNQQANAYTALADKYAGFGAPSRARYEASFAPGFTMDQDPGYRDALDQTAKSTMRSLSVNGNPAGSPNAWTQTLQDVNQKFAYPALQNYRATNSNAGGISTLNAASVPAAQGAIQQQGNVFNALGAGANDIFNPRKSLAQQLAEFK